MVTTLPSEAWLTALASLPKMGPRRLLALSLLHSPADAWQLVLAGAAAKDPALAARMGRQPTALAAAWRSAAAKVDVGELWDAHRAVTVAGRESPQYPGPLVDDLEPPAVVYLRGDPGALSGPRVAVVGTRRCTRYGFEVAKELGHDLSKAGVRVVSGLALGIDGAAHRGALDAGGAPPIGVVASGLDVVYPRRHRGLWEEVAEAGLLISESPLGTVSEPWRFPARNRIIAALADVLVVVESPGSGGSMYTVEQALTRSIDVMAVPGPVRSLASAGTNRLIYEGASMARDCADVLMALGISPPPNPRAEQRPPPDQVGRAVLDALGWQPAGLEALVARTGLSLASLAVSVAELEAAGWIQADGLKFERVSTP